MVNGYDLVESSVSRANRAYSENTALQEEFDAKAETTASQMQVMRNNVTEAARSFGEVMLPTITDVAGGVADFAKGLANADDGTKRAVATTGIAVAGLGLAGKAVAVVGGGIGKVISGVGTLGTALGAAAVPVGITAAAVVGLGAAVYGIHSAYEQYRHDQLYFAEGASQAAAALKKQRSAMDEVNDYAWEFKDLQMKLNSDDISEEEKIKSPNA